MILPLVPMTFFSETFYRLCGMKIGRETWINTFAIMDPYLVQRGDGTVVGGDAIISPHLYEGGHLLLERIRIGRHCLRKGRTVPSGARVASLAGLDSRQIRAMERTGKPAGRPRA